MGKRFITKGVLISSVVLFACGGGEGSDPYINPYATTVNGEITQQGTTALGYKVDGKDLQYISAFSKENGKLVYTSSLINPDGTFKINLKKDLKYSFVLFDSNSKPVLYVKQNSGNVFIIRGDTYIKIIIKLNPDGTVEVADLKHDENSLFEWDDLYDDSDGDEIPDFAEMDPDYDEDGDGIFDGIEDKDNNSYIDGSEDTDNDMLPDPIDDDDDNDGIPDDQDEDDDNDGIPDEEDND